MTGPVFKKKLDVLFEFEVCGPCPICQHGWWGVHDLCCSQPQEGDKSVLGSLYSYTHNGDCWVSKPQMKHNLTKQCCPRSPGSLFSCCTAVIHRRHPQDLHYASRLSFLSFLLNAAEFHTMGLFCDEDVMRMIQSWQRPPD